MNRQSERKICEVGAKLLDVDKFGQSYGLHLDQGKEALPSKMGTFCSFLLPLILIAYAGYKVNILQGKKSVDILQAVNKHYFDDEYTFGAKQGLDIAIGVTDYHRQDAYELIDPKFGKITFTVYSFGLNEEGLYEVFSEKVLQSHQCSLQELGLVGTGHKFFPINQKQRRSL